MSTTTDSIELQNLIRRFKNYKSQISQQFSAKSAAVLVCLYEEQREDKSELRVILTKRASNLSSHSGEVALPGGKRDEEDSDDIATALREAHEEIGLDPSLVTIVSVLEPFVTKGMPVVPVIGFLPDKKTFKPLPNPAEVEEIFDVPLDMFLKDKNRRSEEREYEGYKYLLHYFDYYSEDKEINFIIWALTAGILIRVASIVYQKSPEFQEHKPIFWNQPNH